MRIGLLAEKIGMSRFFDKEKINHSVTILKVRDCKVVSVNKIEKNGYNSITLSHGINDKKIGKPFKGFLKKNNLKAFSNSQEFRVTDSESFKIGDKVGVNNFMVGQFVDVSSNSIGKGFAGGMKRHNFAGNRATHGVSISHRSHGSTGQCQDPGKVFKGKKMAGRLGNKKVTVQNLKILELDIENELLVIKGAIPGHKGSVISIVDSVKKNQDIKLNQDSESSPVETVSEKNDIAEKSPVVKEKSEPVESKTEQKTQPADAKTEEKPSVDQANPQENLKDKE